MDKHFSTKWGRDKHFTQDGGGNDGDVADVYGEEDVSEANILLKGSKILVSLYSELRTAHF